MVNHLKKKPAKKQKDDLISVLISQGTINDQQAEKLRDEAKKSNQPVYDYLLVEEIVDEDLLLKAASILFGLSLTRLNDISISKEILSLVPENIARKYKVIPFEKEGRTIKLALNNPYNLPNVDKEILDARKDNDFNYKFYLAKINDLKLALSQYNKLKSKKDSKSIEVQKRKEVNEGKGRYGLKNDLLKILVKQNAIDQPKAVKFQEQAENSNDSIEDLLIKKGFDESLIQKAKAQKEGIEFIPLSSKKIDDKVLQRIPFEVARKYGLIAYDEIGERIIKVAAVDVDSRALKDIINFAQTKKGIDIKLSLTTRKDVEQALSNYKNKSYSRNEIENDDGEKKDQKPQQNSSEPKTSQNFSLADKKKGKQETEEKVEKKESSEEDDGDAHEQLKGKISSLVKRKVKSIEDLNSIIEKGSVPRIVAAVVNFALSKRASDVHIQPTDKDSLLRYRIDGVLNNVTEIPGDLHSAIVSRIKILSKLRIDEKRVPQDGRFEVSFDKREIDLRVSTMPTTDNEKVVLRLLDKSKKEFNLEDLGMKGTSYSKLTKNIKKPYGMIVATGPTGSGKSTTLYAAMSKINNPKINIITLEDPIEYELKGVSQSQARPDIGYSFANGLRSVLRQDPDVIMVGEIRDKETAEMSIHAALTGHLLFTTLHTNDAAGAIPRLIDMGIEPFLISSASNAFLAQRLVRKICDKCKQEDPKFDDLAKKKLKSILSNLPKGEKKAVSDENDWKLYRGQGCDQCYQGYKGRLGIFEVLEINENIRSMIHKDSSISQIRNTAIKDGMVTMEQDGAIKALKGLTTLEEIFRVTGAVEEQF